MDAYVNILRRLTLFLGKVPPELIMGALFAVPAMLGFLAGLPWIVGLLIEGFVMWYLTAFGISDTNVATLAVSYIR